METSRTTEVPAASSRRPARPSLTRRRALAAVGVAAALLLAGCGDDDADGTDPQNQPETTAPAGDDMSDGSMVEDGDDMSDGSMAEDGDDMSDGSMAEDGDDMSDGSMVEDGDDMSDGSMVEDGDDMSDGSMTDGS